MVHPNSLKNLQKGRKYCRCPCPYCELSVTTVFLTKHVLKCVKNPDFGTPCPKCGTLKHPSKQTCSTSCYNSLFRAGVNNPRFKSNPNYRTLCFLHHEPKCCVCGWDLIVEVHHYDEDRSNNSPENLIPMCPNHHQLWHSSKRPLIEDVVRDYYSKFKESSGL